MKEFMTEDFLLNSDTARELYHKYAENMPIIDYHCQVVSRVGPVDKVAKNPILW